MQPQIDPALNVIIGRHLCAEHARLCTFAYIEDLNLYAEGDDYFSALKALAEKVKEFMNGIDVDDPPPMRPSQRRAFFALADGIEANGLEELLLCRTTCLYKTDYWGLRQLAA